MSVETMPMPSAQEFQPVDQTAELMQRFSVSEAVARDINALDTGAGIHSGGYISPEDAAPGVATATAGYDSTPPVERFADITGARELYNSLPGLSDEAAISSNQIAIPAGMSMEDAQKVVVQRFLGQNSKVRERPTAVFTAQNMKPEDPTLLVGTADVKNHNGQRVLQVSTGKDHEGKVIGFTVSQRKWDAGKYPDDTGYRGVVA